MQIHLAYGREGLSVELPQDAPVTIIEPRFVPGLPDEQAALVTALRSPVGTPPLRELVRPDDTVAVVFSDLTRPMPNDRVLPPLLGELARAGVPDGQIVLVNALGTHRPQTEAELRHMLGGEVAERYRGAPRLNCNPESGETLCIACELCAQACPEKLIVVSSVRNENTRRKDLTAFTFDTSRCMFCGLCEDACPTDALELTQDFELASYSRDGAIWDRRMLEDGPRPEKYVY